MAWTHETASAGQLPLGLNSFVGRRREVTEVKRLLGEARLVTLTGIGGTGKTRLAVQVAGLLRGAFSDGVWFVDLASLRAPELPVLATMDPEVLASLVLTALGVRAQPAGGPATNQLVEFLTSRQSLVVLDNCEHLLPGCRVLVDALLRGCRELRILTTSREPLFVDGERLFPVPPLLAPDAGDRVRADGWARYPALALFVDRGQAVAPDFALTADTAVVVADVCRRLDGLPLAIELAAAQVRMLAPQQILARLNERFALLTLGGRTAPVRQQTLRASVEWSFDLCSKAERLLWARASVFVGGFELDAVEGVCADDTLRDAELLKVLAGLVDKSILVRADRHAATARYQLLETLREFGQEKLHVWDQYDELRRRHREWYTDLARRFEAEVISSRQPDWFARLGRELPNLRAAMEHSLADPDGVEAALTIPSSSLLHWGVHGLHREGSSWVDRALARPGFPTVTRLKALFASAGFSVLRGDVAAAEARVREADDVAARHDGPLAHAFADAVRGVAAVAGDPADALQRAADTFAAEPADEYLFWQVNVLATLAISRAVRGDAAGAGTAHEAVLAICQPRGETWYAGFSLYTLGLGLWKQDPPGAAARLKEALRDLRRVNDTFGTALCMETLAWIAFDEGRPAKAAILLGMTCRLADTLGARTALIPELAANHEQCEQGAREALGDTAYQAAFARGEQMSLDEAIADALDEPRQSAAPEPVADLTPLTRREREIAAMLAQGLSNTEIASKLVISRRTAESHVAHILTKLELKNRTQVAAWLTTTGAVDVDAS